MFPKRFAVCAFASVAFLVAGCSSGGGKAASPTTTIATTSSTAVTTTTASPSPVVASVGPCPKALPISFALLNYYIRDLSKRPVPVRALTTLRVCQYSFDGRLVYSRVLGQKVAAPFADETNRLSPGSPGPLTSCPPTRPTFFLTFASQTQRVSIVSYHCGAVVNGAIVVQPTTKWFNDLYVNLIDGRVLGGGPTG
jgi:hypothetical protein